jgi:AcrR family transcriptional regulator
MAETTYMRIGELAEKAGLPRSTVHYYLREGLLPPPRRTGRTMAYYDERHLERLQLIRELRGDHKMPVAFLKERIAELEAARGEKKVPRTAGETGPDPKSRRRREIIEAAMRVFSRKGFHKTNVRDITADAGISTGAFYLYFSGKRAVFREAMDEIIRDMMESIEASVIEEEEDVKKRMLMRGFIFYEQYSGYSDMLYQLRAEMASEEEWAREKGKIIYRHFTEPLTSDIRKATEQGVSRNLDPELLAYTFIGVIEILSLRMRLDNKYDFTDIMAFIEDFAMHGVSPAHPDNAEA